MSDRVPAGAVGVATPPANTPVLSLGVAAPSLRRPRCAVTLGGRPVPERMLVDAKWNVNGYQSADSFSITLVMDDRPGAEWPPSYFSDTTLIEVQVLAGAPSATTVQIDGRVDQVELDYDKREIRLGGRDRTADFIEAKTTEKFPNQTSSEIATMLAGRRGLTPQVTATTTRSGTYYTRDHSRLTNDTTEWALLTFLAEQEGFEVYVRGRTLYFGPPVAEAEAGRWALNYEPPTMSRAYPTAPTPGFNLVRNLTVSRDLLVEVISYNSGSAQRIRAVARAEGARRATQGAAQRYVIRQPGLTLEQATALAQRKLGEFSRHERIVTASAVPADERLTLRHLLVLSGTGTEFDQSYRIDSIVFSMTQQGGFTMTIRARNLAPTSTVSV